ncbi:Transmembrane protein fend [Frankliniella fusca]|uniref:Transmembrane protein fend n=1 Tax=Frankliniella fusca TaxID=407009 RepID=A0AAE1LDW0_9NEOP|nr:Transmembrane protein fend [Frankliniella fusca]
MLYCGVARRSAAEGAPAGRPLLPCPAASCCPPVALSRAWQARPAGSPAGQRNGPAGSRPFPGCQQACAFHRRSRPHRQQQAVVLTDGRPAVRTQGGRASWPAPAPAAPARPGPRPLVYVVMRRTTQPAWTQVAQTVELSARLPEDMVVARHSLRVLVVGPDGLQTIYSPEEAATPAAQAAASTTASPAPTAASVAATTPPTAAPAGPEGAASPQRRINTAIKAASLAGPGRPQPTPAPAAPASNGWQLREDSLIHQKVLVIAELSWAPRGPHGGVYLVTWEVDGGGLKGNLFTDSTHVTLSLWPDTVYHVQVELVSDSKPGPAQSASLVVDTRHAVPSTLGSRGPTASSRIPLSIAASSSTSSSSSSSAVQPASVTLDAALHRGPFLMLAPVPNKRHVAAGAEKHLGDAVRRPAPRAGATLLAVGAAVVLVSLAVGAILVWRCRGAFFRRGAGVVGDSSPFIGALAVEEGDLPPAAVKKVGALSAAFTAPPPQPDMLMPVVTLVSEGEVSRPTSTPCAAPACRSCLRGPSSAAVASPSWRHVNMATSWSFAPSPSSPLPTPSPVPARSPSPGARV